MRRHRNTLSRCGERLTRPANMLVHEGDQQASVAHHPPALPIPRLVTVTLQRLIVDGKSDAHGTPWQFKQIAPDYHSMSDLPNGERFSVKTSECGIFLMRTTGRNSTRSLTQRPT